MVILQYDRSVISTKKEHIVLMNISSVLVMMKAEFLVTWEAIILNLTCEARYKSSALNAHYASPRVSNSVLRAQ